jgi:hypothetical protein
MSRTFQRIKEELDAMRASRRVTSRKCLSAPVSRSPIRSHISMTDSLVEYVGKRAITCERCRPRIPHVYVTVHDRHKRSTSHVDVAFLQDYDDRYAALRELIRIQFNSVTDIFHKLDLNGNGRLTVEELMDCLTNLHVPWQQVSGLTRVEFSNLVDCHNTGIVDILEFLGAMGLTPRLPWSALPPLEQWEEYTNKILELDLMNMEPCQPLWWSVLDGTSRQTHGLVTMNIIKRSSLDVAERLMSPSSSRDKQGDFSRTTVYLSRDDLDFIQTKVRRIEKFLRDFNDNKRELCKLKNDLQNVTEAEERMAESNKKREEEEIEQRRLKQEAGLALVMNESGTKRSIFGNRNKVELSQFRKPSEDELVNFFDTRKNININELAFREFLKTRGLSLFAGDRIRRVFERHAGTCITCEETFSVVMADLVDSDIPQSKLKQFWLSASVGGTVSLNLLSFISWFTAFNS